jgi:hypothetical protein
MNASQCSAMGLQLAFAVRAALTQRRAVAQRTNAQEAAGVLSFVTCVWPRWVACARARAWIVECGRTCEAYAHACSPDALVVTFPVVPLGSGATALATRSRGSSPGVHARAADANVSAITVRVRGVLLRRLVPWCATGARTDAR